MHIGNFHLRLLAFLIPLPVNYKQFGLIQVLNRINNVVLKVSCLFKCVQMFEIFNRSFTCNQFSKKKRLVSLVNWLLVQIIAFNMTMQSFPHSTIHWVSLNDEAKKFFLKSQFLF